MTMHTICTKWAWWVGRSSSSNNNKKKDSLVEAALTISILLLSLLWFMLIFMKSRKERALLPPGPLGLPVLGYLPFLGTNLHTEFSELARRYGPIFKLQLGNKLCVVLSSPSLIKEVTREQDIFFANRDPPVVALTLTYGGFDIAWSSYGPTGAI
ncbi:hypothetical protein ACH5RR_038596 [Cinchona calisaya]|uniref:Cytochrome P450 n=1 Tax=Cinchona calisaya TaxID=153742 RepID=A0ABD2Y1C5_9GENT